MLRKGKHDWFSIVATDLFCGVLSAVIILDAVSPKDVIASGVATFIELRYQQSLDTNCSDPGAVVFAFRDTNGQQNSLDDGLVASARGDGMDCVQEILFHAIELDGEPLDAMVIFSETTDSPIAEVSSIKLNFAMKCERTSQICAAVQ